MKQSENRPSFGNQFETHQHGTIGLNFLFQCQALSNHALLLSLLVQLQKAKTPETKQCRPTTVSGISTSACISSWIVMSKRGKDDGNGGDDDDEPTSNCRRCFLSSNNCASTSAKVIFFFFLCFFFFFLFLRCLLALGPVVRFLRR